MKKNEVMIAAIAITIAVAMAAIFIIVIMPEEQKLNETIEVQLGQPVIINMTTNELRLGEKFPYSEAIPELNLNEGEQGFMFWTFCVPEIKAGHYQIIDLKEGRIQEKPGITKAFGAISYDGYNNGSHFLLTGYQEEGETRTFENLQITWEKTMKSSGERYGYGDEYVIVIYATISET